MCAIYLARVCGLFYGRGLVRLVRPAAIVTKSVGALCARTLCARTLWAHILSWLRGAVREVFAVGSGERIACDDMETMEPIRVFQKVRYPVPERDCGKPL